MDVNPPGTDRNRAGRTAAGPHHVGYSGVSGQGKRGVGFGLRDCLWVSSVGGVKGGLMKRSIELWLILLRLSGYGFGGLCVGGLAS